MKKQGVLAVVSGFSGAGKGTVMKALLEKYDNYALSISATTRDPRPGEENGREYFFVSEETFLSMIEHDELIEHARYVNHYYGTPRAYVEEKMAEGKDVILEIEIQGALKIKETFPDALLIFIVPPTAKELENRLTGRGTETKEVIEKRLKRAKEESDGMDSYDYILVNDEVEACVETLHGLIQSQHLRVSGNRELIARMKAELKELCPGE
jgi:guanylate kinase